MSTETTPYVQDGTFVRESLGDEFTDLLGAFFLTGFNYTVENKCIEEFVNVVTLRGFRVDEDGEKIAGTREVAATWERRGDQWVIQADETGLLQELKDGSIKFHARTPDQLIEYVSQRVNEWDLNPLADEVEEDVDTDVEEAVSEEEPIEEEVEETTDEAGSDEPTDEQPALPAA